MTSPFFHHFPGRPGRVRFSLPAAAGKAPAAALPTRRPREALGGAMGIRPQNGICLKELMGI